MTAHLSRRAFAKVIGVSETRIRQHIERGLPVTPEGKIDPDVAKRWLEENTDHQRKNGWKGERRGPEGPSLAEEKRSLERIKVQQAQLDLDRARGKLIDRDKVRRFLEARGRLDRDAHLAFVSRLSAMLAGEFETDPAQLHARLEAEMREHLRSLAETPVPEEEVINESRVA
jgi:ribosomal protein L19E